MTQKNYEAIKIYRQKEQLFELKGKIQSLETENQQLKELLKECLPIVSAEIMTWQIRGGEESYKKGQEILTRINTAIGAIGENK